MKKSTAIKLGLSFFLVLLNSGPVLAHKVRVFAWEDSGMIVTESQFNSGRPAKNAIISVIDTTTGHQLLSGTTNGDGLFSFPTPAGTESAIEIIVDCGDGHKNSWFVTPEEETNSGDSKGHSHREITEPLTRPPAVTISSEELQQIVEGALDKKLAPIKRSLAESADHKPTFQDILGGIGYIFGLAGIAAYFQSQKQRKE